MLLLEVFHTTIKLQLLSLWPLLLLNSRPNGDLFRPLVIYLMSLKKVIGTPETA